MLENANRSKLETIAIAYSAIIQKQFVQLLIATSNVSFQLPFYFRQMAPQLLLAALSKHSIESILTYVRRVSIENIRS